MCTCWLFHPQASSKELRVIQIVSILFFGSLSMAIALWSSVIYGVFILAADIVYVIIFPQLTTILYLPKYCNPVGAICGFLVGLILRIGAGEDIIKMPAWIYFPFFNEMQLFPFRTFAMLVSFVTVLAVTCVTRLQAMRFVCERFEYSAVHQDDGVSSAIQSGTHTDKAEARMVGDTDLLNTDRLKDNEMLQLGDTWQGVRRQDCLEMDLMVNGKFRKLNAHGDV